LDVLFRAWFLVRSEGEMPLALIRDQRHRETENHRAMPPACRHRKSPSKTWDRSRIDIARRGFEPRLSDPESLVLPLHHQAEGQPKGDGPTAACSAKYTAPRQVVKSENRPGSVRRGGRV